MACSMGLGKTNCRPTKWINHERVDHERVYQVSNDNHARDRRRRRDSGSLLVRLSGDRGVRPHSEPRFTP